MSGSAIAQIISFSLSPVISRLFTPGDFGIFGSFTSILSIIAAGATLQYSQALMLPKEKSDAINVLMVSFLSTALIGILISTTCLIIPQKINGLMKTSGFFMPLLLILGSLVNGLDQSCNAWCIRVKAFKTTAKTSVIRSLAQGGSQVGLGFAKTGAPGLIIGTVLADFLATINLFRTVFKSLRKYKDQIEWGKIKRLAKEYNDFPMYSASQNVINAISSGIPVLLLTHYYGLVVAGAYAFGLRILWTPMSFITSALRQVLFQRAAEIQHKNKKLTPLYFKTTAGMFSLSVLPTIILMIWAPTIFSFIFGDQWYSAGEYARVLILWMMFVFCNLPAVLFARLIRIQRAVFFYDLCLLSVRVAVLMFGGLYLTALQTISLFSLVGAFMNFLLVIMVGFNILKKEGISTFERLKIDIK